MLSNAVTAIERIKQEISQLRRDNAEAAKAAASGIISVDEANTNEARNRKLVELLNEIATLQRSKVHF
jgi:hypothetical protein